jgi:hypothetical protein
VDNLIPLHYSKVRQCYILLNTFDQSSHESWCAVWQMFADISEERALNPSSGQKSNPSMEKRGTGTERERDSRARSTGPLVRLFIPLYCITIRS